MKTLLLLLIFNYQLSIFNSIDGLEGNPAHTGEVFTDNCAYVKHSGQNRKERDKVEKACEKIAIKNDLKILSEKYTSNEFKCKLDGDEKTIQNKAKTINHFFDGLFGKKDLFWLRNEIIKEDLSALLKDVTLIGEKVSDTTHNTNKETIRLKKATDFFFYYKKTLPNGEIIYLHIGRYKETGNMYLYDATAYNPIKE